MILLFNSVEFHLDFLWKDFSTFHRRASFSPPLILPILLMKMRGMMTQPEKNFVFAALVGTPHNGHSLCLSHFKLEFSAPAGKDRCISS